MKIKKFKGNILTVKFFKMVNYFLSGKKLPNSSAFWRCRHKVVVREGQLEYFHLSLYSASMWNASFAVTMFHNFQPQVKQYVR